MLQKYSATTELLFTIKYRDLLQNFFYITATLCHCNTEIGVPYGIRTRVAAVKGQRPRPLDEGDYVPSSLQGVLPKIKKEIDYLFAFFQETQSFLITPRIKAGTCSPNPISGFEGTGACFGEAGAFLGGVVFLGGAGVFA